MSSNQSTPITVGPHCSHDECAWTTCDHSGYVEHPCHKTGCELCGAPDSNTPEQWAGSPQHYAAATAEDRARMDAYLQRYPLIRRPGDPQNIPNDRVYPQEQEWL